MPRTALLTVAAVALMSGAPLYWASTAEGSNGSGGAMAPKDPFGNDLPDDCPGDDPDATTGPGMTTTADKGQAKTTVGTSAPGVTTAPGATSAGGREAKGHDDTTAGHDTSTRPGHQTSTGGHGTDTTAGETNETGAVQETETVVCPPVTPPPPGDEVTPPPPGVTPPPPGVTPPPPGAAPPPPGVQGIQAQRPTARLSAPAGCPPQRFFARVSGRGIARVVFTLDGRRVKTLTRPDAVGIWKYRVNTRRLSTGKHRIVARVTFRATSAAFRQSTPRTSRVLSITFTRCARKASAPKFTG